MADTDRTQHRRRRGVSAAVCLAVAAPAAAEEMPRCMPLTVPTAYVEEAPEPYRDFCLRNVESCRLSGPDILDWSPALSELLRATNEAVNASVAFVPDVENSGQVEIWDYPDEGRGDCEDFVLEKRRRLVDAGLPSATLTCGIAFHQVQLFPHAVLFVETTAGTLVLDNLHDAVLCWDAVPYFYTLRERPDGLWTRFRQP